MHAHCRRSLYSNLELSGCLPSTWSSSPVVLDPQGSPKTNITAATEGTELTGYCNTTSRSQPRPPPASTSSESPAPAKPPPKPPLPEESEPQWPLEQVAGGPGAQEVGGESETGALGELPSEGSGPGVMAVLPEGPEGQQQEEQKPSVSEGVAPARVSSGDQKVAEEKAGSGGGQAAPLTTTPSFSPSPRVIVSRQGDTLPTLM